MLKFNSSMDSVVAREMVEVGIELDNSDQNTVVSVREAINSWLYGSFRLHILIRDEGNEEKRKIEGESSSCFKRITKLDEDSGGRYLKKKVSK